jgi:hypothetical protein
VQRVLVLGTAAFGYLPRVPLKRVAVLPYEVDVVVLDGQDADGDVLVVDDAVDARLAVGPDHPVLPHGDPGVLVDPPRPERPPRVVSFLLGHRPPCYPALFSGCYLSTTDDPIRPATQPPAGRYPG